jgi:hypothetical protein
VIQLSNLLKSESAVADLRRRARSGRARGAAADELTRDAIRGDR